MDGNGRWAEQRGEQRTAGHRAGASSVRRVIESAPDLGISTLTLYAFSSDNWKRPPHEVEALMVLFAEYLADECQRCIDNGVRVNVIGRRDRLSAPLRARIAQTERATAHGTTLHLRIAVDYSARDAIVRAAAQLSRTPAPSRRAFSDALNAAINSRPAAPDVDLLIRTSGEQRLSDYLLWECAYAELLFCEKLWPDFGEQDLARAIEAYRLRERRFGATSPAAASAVASVAA